MKSQYQLQAMSWILVTWEMLHKEGLLTRAQEEAIFQLQYHDTKEI